MEFDRPCALFQEKSHSILFRRLPSLPYRLPASVSLGTRSRGLGRTREEKGKDMDIALGFRERGGREISDKNARMDGQTRSMRALDARPGGENRRSLRSNAGKGSRGRVSLIRSLSVSRALSRARSVARSFALARSSSPSSSLVRACTQQLVLLLLAL